MKIKFAFGLFLLCFGVANHAFSQDLNPAGQPHLIGYWKFQDRNNLTQSTVGSNLLLTGKHEWVKGPAFGDTAIRIAIGSYYTFTHKIKPNGGGNRVNQYTLMFDFKVLNFNKWHTFFQLDSTNKNDGECFIRPKTGSNPGRIGVAATSYTKDSINPNQWYRLMITVNNGHFYRYYLNGQLVLEGDTQDIDDRFSLGTQILFFADENQEDDTIDIASVAMFDTCLSTAQVAAIGTIEPCIANPPRPKLGNDTLLCANQSLIKNAGSGYTKYTWSTGAKSQSALLDLSRLKLGKNTVWVKVTDPNSCEATDTIIITYAPNPIVELGRDTAVCSGSNVLLTAGTDSTYQYIWKYFPGGNTLSNLNNITVGTSGNYYAQATNASGCIGRDTIAITENPNPGKPTITAGGNTKFCEGDSVVLTANAGYAHYLWNHGGDSEAIKVTTSDTLFLQVEDQNGCRSIFSDSVVVQVYPNPKQIILNNYRDTFFCSNDSIVLHASGGYSGYLWQDGSQDSFKVIKKSGNYSVRILDLNSCMSKPSNQVYVEEKTAPVQPQISPTGNQGICMGDSIQLAAPSGFVKYLWNDNQSSEKIRTTTAGSFKVKVMNAQGCYSDWSNAVLVTLHSSPSKPTIAVSGKDSLKCKEPHSKYRWWSSAVNGILVDSSSTVPGIPYTYYKVQAFNGNCWSEYSDTFLFIPWSVKEFQKPRVQIYPNPVLQNARVLIPWQTSTPVSIYIYDNQGKLVYTNTRSNSQEIENMLLDLSGLARGTYHIAIRNNDKNAFGTLLKQ